MGIRAASVQGKVTRKSVTIKGILAAKRDGEALTREHIKFFIDNCVKGVIPNYQISAWLMAVRINGMTDEETSYLTEAMTDSGKRLDLSQVEGITVDKHSTGGVSDGTSLVIAPLVATFGLKIPMMSGRGLAHTGGTLDKLESIPGFSVNLSESAIVNQLNNVGLAIFGQTQEIAPADKILYGLRDVTETVDSIPLIAASIMSKKLAEGSQGLVMNVTTGTGAFMQHFGDAKKLAETMVAIAKNAGRKASSVISSMDQPLGPMIGNAMEVKQALRILAGEQTGFENFIEAVIELSAHMLVHGGLYPLDELETARNELRNRLVSGQAFSKFRQMAEAQGGEVRTIEDLSLLAQASKMIEVMSTQAGYVEKVSATEIGIAAMFLGAGRETLESKIDPAVGIEVLKFIGDKVEVGEPLAKLHVNNDERLEMSKKTLLGAYQVGACPVEKPKLILETIT